jgi:Xaa-Pro aminopeptidase
VSGPFARGGGRADFELRVDLVALRAERLARVQAALRASPLDALLLWRDENVRYLTGLRAQIISGKSALLNGVFLADGRAPVLLCSGGEVDRVRAVMPWIEDARAIPIMEAAGLVREAVRGTLAPLVREAGAGAVGIDECAYAQVAELRQALPGVALHDGDPLMQTCRVRKSAGELAVMEEAAAIAEGVTAAALDAVRPGVRELDIAGEALRALHRLGGETAHLATPFVASGERMAPPNRMATDKLVREGDLVFIDIGSMWNGYYSDLGRTTVCGKPSAEQRRVYRAVHAGLQAGTGAMRTGATTTDVAAAVTGAAREHGLADRFLSLFIGHGIGMGANEPPYVGEQQPGAEEATLEEGMTLALEPLIWLPGVRGGAGVRLEDTIAVTPDGGRPLTRTAFDERLLA